MAQRLIFLRHFLRFILLNPYADIDSEMAHDTFCTNKSCGQVRNIQPSNSGLPKCKSWSKPGYPDRGSCHVLRSTHASSHIFYSVLNSSLTLHCYVVQLLTASLNHQHIRKWINLLSHPYQFAVYNYLATLVLYYLYYWQGISNWSKQFCLWTNILNQLLSGLAQWQPIWVIIIRPDTGQ